jgi:protein-serine/threonine kinase
VSSGQIFYSQPPPVQIPQKRLKSSQSTPTLVDRISSQLFHPTVVHRPALKARPSLISMAVPSESDSSAPASPTDTAATSMYFSDDSQKKPPSTEASSVSPSSLRGSSKEGMRSIIGLLSQTTISSNPTSVAPLERVATHIEELPTIAEDETISPSITTIETTASTKVFFETYFHHVLNRHIAPRSQRRRNLEYKLQSQPLPPSEKAKRRRDFLRRETDHLRETRVLKAATLDSSNLKGVVVEGYDVVKILGKGSFGVVRLVREKDSDKGYEASDIASPRPALASRSVTRDVVALSHAAPRKQVYAMKVIRKSEMLRSSQEGHIWAERDFLVASEGSRWVVPLIASFQDSSNLYLVMDFMIGGDFLGLLIRKDKLREDVTRFYIAEIILCIEEVHAMGWIHRDIKPDNFLISASGHLKISDFGLAFDGHWSHDQGFFSYYRYALVNRFNVVIEGDNQDKEARKSILGAQRLANALRGRKSSVLRSENRGTKILDERNQQPQRALAESMVGTSQYMAPEIIRGDLYDGRCD